MRRGAGRTRYRRAETHLGIVKRTICGLVLRPVARSSLEFLFMLLMRLTARSLVSTASAEIARILDIALFHLIALSRLSSFSSGIKAALRPRPRNVRSRATAPPRLSFGPSFRRSITPWFFLNYALASNFIPFSTSRATFPHLARFGENCVAE